MFDDQQGDAAVPEFFQQGHQVFRFPGVQPRGGFVHEQQLGFLGQSPGDFQAPLVPVGQGFGGEVRLVCQPHQLQQRQGPLPVFGPGPAHPGQRQQGRQGPHLLAQVAAGEDVFHDRHAPEELDILESAGQAQTGPGVGGQAHQVLACQPDGAAGGPQEAVDEIEAGGLARAVGADETGNPPGRGAERHARQGLDPAEMFAEVTDFQ